MKKGLSEIVLVLDRSGSMSSTKSDAEGGLREFIAKQRLIPGQCDVTFWRFDSDIECVFDKKPIERVEDGELKLEPRGSTALLEAMDRAIDAVGHRLSLTMPDERPEHVYFLTITDGEENASWPNRRDVYLDAITRFPYNPLASRETFEQKKTALFNKIKRQQEQYKWEFVFIGANQDAIATAASMNIAPQYSLSYSGDRIGTMNAYASLTNNVTRGRMTGETLCFTQEERKSSMESDATGTK